MEPQAVFEGSKDAVDDRICGPSGKKVLSTFALIHLSSHYISMANLLSYGLHALLYGEEGLAARALIGAGVEFVLVLMRFWNEFRVSKIGLDDYLHHIAHIIGVGLVVFRPDCREFLYLLTRMNILHFPCFVYYFACRKNGASFVNCYVGNEKYALSMMDFARVIFPCMWISAVSFRAGSMIIAVYNSYFANGLSIACISLSLLGTCLGYLDTTWSKYFLAEVDFPGVWYQIGGFSPAFINAFILCSVLLGLLCSLV